MSVVGGKAGQSGHLPIFGTLALATDLARQAPARLTVLVIAQLVLVTTSSWLADRYAAPIAGPALAKIVDLVVGQSAFAISNGAIVAVAFAASERRRCGIGAALHASAARFWPMLLVGVVQALLVQIGALIPKGGIALAVMTVGILVILLTAAAGPVCMIEKRGPIASLSRSFALSRGNRWRIVALAFVTALVALAVLLFFGLLIIVLGVVVGALLDLILKQFVAASVLALLAGSGSVVLVLVAAIPPFVLVALVPMSLYLNLHAVEAGRPSRHRLSDAAGPEALEHHDLG